MQFEDVLNKRYSVRKFDGRKVEKEKIDAILNAARIAPTAKNNQLQRIFVLESGDALEKLKKSTIYHFNAPLAFLICYDNTLSWTRPFDGKDCGQVDAAIITTYMMLEATAQGLGTTWVGYLDPEVVRETFGLPENLMPVAFLPAGYPAADCVPSERHALRKQLADTVTVL